MASEQPNTNSIEQSSPRQASTKTANSNYQTQLDGSFVSAFDVPETLNNTNSAERLTDSSKTGETENGIPVIADPKPPIERVLEAQKQLTLARDKATTEGFIDDLQLLITAIDIISEQYAPEEAAKSDIHSRSTQLSTFTD